MPEVAAEKATGLDLKYAYTPVLCLATGDLSTYTITVDAGTDIVTAAGHDFVDGVAIEFSNSGGALPDGLVSGTIYFVVSTATNTFQVAETVGGSAIDITSTGSGTNTVTEVEFDLVRNLYPDADVAWSALVRHEVADYQGSGRQSFSWGSSTIDSDSGTASLSTVTASVIPVSATVTFRYAVVLRGGNTTVGDSTGAIAILEDVGETIIGFQGQSFSFSNPIHL